MTVPTKNQVNLLRTAMEACLSSPRWYSIWPLTRTLITVKPGLAQEDGGEEKAETTTPAQPSADHHQHQDTSGETNQDDQQQPGKHQWL
jgi:hypothetical protein